MHRKINNNKKNNKKKKKEKKTSISAFNIATVTKGW